MLLLLLLFLLSLSRGINIISILLLSSHVIRSPKRAGKCRKSREGLQVTRPFCCCCVVAAAVIVIVGVVAAAAAAAAVVST